MRAREFTINVPINISINGDGEAEVSADQQYTNPLDSPESIPCSQEPVTKAQQPRADDSGDETFVPPLQQEIELQKAALGKKSEVIANLTDDEETDNNTKGRDHT